jgi:hypothetical protein
MAFTITKQPNKITSGYNPMWFDVISSFYAGVRFKYIFKLYVNDNLVSTTKLFPRPNYNCIYDPQPIVKNFLDGKIVDYINEVTAAQDGYVAKFYVEFYYEIELAGVLTESALQATSETIRVYEMVTQEYNEKPEDFIYKYTPHSTSANPVNVSLANLSGPRIVPYNSWSLTNTKPIDIKETYEMTVYDRTTLSVIARDADYNYQIVRFVIRTFTNTGQIKVFGYVIPAGLLTTDKENDILHIPVNIVDLNLMTPFDSVIPTGLSSYITPDEDIALSVEMKADESVGVYRHNFKPVMFRIVEPYDRYERTRLMYKTDIGGWWYIPFTMKSYYSEENSRTLIESKPNYSDDNKFISKPVINMNGSGSYILNSDFLDSDLRVQEMRDLLRSPIIYICKYNSDTDSITETPVIINTSSYQVKTIKQDKVIQYSIKVDEAFNKKFAI